MIVASLLALALLLAAHLFSGKLRFLEVTPRSRWLSLAGGISVAYVFVHLLPELAETQEMVSRRLGGELGFLEHHVYLIALTGLAVFYGLERQTHRSMGQRRTREGEPRPSAGAFWLSMGSFAIYNVIIGYLLLHRISRGLGTLAMFAIAMALHFVVNDFGLRERHREQFTQVGRWVLAGAATLGWGLGLVVEVPEAALGILVAFLAGGVVLNVLKEELPEERKSRFWAFALGCALYTALLLAT